MWDCVRCRAGGGKVSRGGVVSRGGTEIEPGYYRPLDYSLGIGLDYMYRYTAQVITSKYFAIRRVRESSVGCIGNDI
jgi:hypothetical protein